jgi:hypothetical protein
MRHFTRHRRRSFDVPGGGAPIENTCTFCGPFVPAASGAAVV